MGIRQAHAVVCNQCYFQCCHATESGFATVQRCAVAGGRVLSFFGAYHFSNEVIVVIMSLSLVQNPVNCSWRFISQVARSRKQKKHDGTLCFRGKKTFKRWGCLRASLRSSAIKFFSFMIGAENSGFGDFYLTHDNGSVRCLQRNDDGGQWQCGVTTRNKCPNLIFLNNKLDWQFSVRHPGLRQPGEIQSRVQP